MLRNRGSRNEFVSNSTYETSTSERSRGLAAAWYLPALIVCGGCASGINVTHVQPGEQTLSGNPWNLGMTQFSVTITRSVVGCGPELKGAVAIVASPELVLDEQQRYVLVSNGWWATSDITSELAATGISTGLNAQSTDATSTVIAGAIGTVAQIAIGLAAGATPPPPKTGQPPPPKAELCSSDVASAIAELYPPPAAKKPGLKALVDQDIAALAASTAKLTLLVAQAGVDASYKTQIPGAMAAQAALQSQLSTRQGLLAKYMNLTSDTQVVKWPRVASEFRRDDPYTLDQAVLDRWTTPSADSPAARQAFSVYLALYRKVPAEGTWVAPSAPRVSNLSMGVPVRLAQTGRLLACAGATCPVNLKEGEKRPNTFATDVVVLQLGQLYNVPLTGGTFKSETAVIAMDTHGLPTKIQVAEKTAAAAALATSTKDAATALAALPAQIRAAELAKTTAQTNQINANVALSTAEVNAAAQGETSILGAQTALLNAQNALATAKANAGIQPQTSAATAQTALLNAQAALVTAQAASTVTDQTSVLAAQTTLINAQAAQINAAAALAKAEVAKP